MRKSIKAALVSGLIFPGAGHFSLKRYQRGMIFFAPSMLSLLVLVYYALNKAYFIADLVAQGTVPLDNASMTNLILAPSSGTELLMLNAATWLFIFCWVISIIDSFMLGNTVDKADSQ